MTSYIDIYKKAVEAWRNANGYENVAPRAALIDMDGTLYHSMANHAKAWHTMMAENGITTDVNEFFLYEGRTGASTINLIFNREFGRDATPEEIERLYRRKTELFTQMPSVSPMPGAAQMLGRLMDRGVKRILVTGSGQNSLINRLPDDFPGAFNPREHVTSHHVTHGKPHPEPYLMAMQRAGVSPNEAIVIENAPLGATAGAASGAFTVALTTGPIPAHTLSEAGAHVVLPSMQVLADTIDILLDTIQ